MALGYLLVLLVALMVVSVPHLAAAKLSDQGGSSNVVVITCNASLAAGTTLQLTDKLDLSGKDPDPINVPWPCAIVGPPVTGAPATIIVPDTDCMLLAQGLVTLSGHLRFVVGKKTKSFDCCRDGEAHGSILCSYSNLTIAAGAVVSVETASDDVIINPSPFWTGQWITVDGTVNASLKSGQMTGLNGVLSSSGVSVGTAGRVIASGQRTIRGAAVQSGDFGTRLDGEVTCVDYGSGDAGGCIAGGRFVAVGASARVEAANGNCTVAGCVISSDDISTYPLLGTVVARNIFTSGDAGAFVSANAVTLAGNGTMEGYNLYSGGGPSIATTNLTLRDHARIVVDGNWGGDGGIIGVTLARLQDNAVLECYNSYADSAGACVLGNIELDGNARIIARNMTARAVGGALAGAYPNQYISVRGSVTIDIANSSAGQAGGAILAHNISFGGGPFAVTLNAAQAACGAAIVAIDAANKVGMGPIAVDGSKGGFIRVMDALELDTSLGCLNIMGQLQPPFQQPCSACGQHDFPPAKKPSCRCAVSSEYTNNTVIECCSGDAV